MELEIVKQVHTNSSFFFSSVRQFYVATTTKIMKKFPFGDSTFRDLAFLNPQQRVNIDTDSGKLYPFFTLQTAVII